MTVQNKGYLQRILIAAVTAAFPQSHGHDLGTGQLACNYNIAASSGLMIAICNLRSHFQQANSMGKPVGHKYQWPSDAVTMQDSPNISNWGCWNCHHKLAQSRGIVPYNQHQSSGPNYHCREKSAFNGKISSLRTTAQLEVPFLFPWETPQKQDKCQAKGKKSNH